MALNNISALTYPFDHQALLTRKKPLRDELLKNPDLLEKRIAILGGSTTAEIKNLLELFLLKEGIKPLFYESEYNKYYEDVLFENQTLRDFKPDVIYFHTSIVNITVFPELVQSPQSVEMLVADEIVKWKTLWNSCATKYPHAVVIQNNFEMPGMRLLGNLDGLCPQGDLHFVRRLNNAMATEIGNIQNIYLQDICYISSFLGLDHWFDKNFWFSYKYAMSFEGMTMVAYNVALLVKAIFGKSRKCLVLDLDNTLWGGVIGDDGVEGLQIGNETPVAEAYTAFQKYLRKLKERGIILAVCSKNDIENAKNGFKHPDTILKLEDFSSFKANWENKDANIKSIALELKIGLESMVFVDDNPAERDLVKAQLPQVAVPDMGDDIAQYPMILDRSGHFEPAAVSEDDLKRSQYYLQDNQRQSMEGAFENYADFLLSLQMKAEIETFEPVYLDRITQLTNKTNQFNLTTRRYTRAQIDAIYQDPQYIKLQGRLTDKFGDNGLISVVIARIEGIEAHLDLWLMSCRVLKRDMELAMMDRIIEECRERGVQKLRGYFFKTAKNAMVMEFYNNLGFVLDACQENNDSIWSYIIPVDYQPKNRFIKVVKSKSELSRQE